MLPGLRSNFSVQLTERSDVFEWFSEQTAFISLCKIKWLVFKTVSYCTGWA